MYLGKKGKNASRATKQRNKALHNPNQTLAAQVLRRLYEDIQSGQPKYRRQGWNWLLSPRYEDEREFWMGLAGVSYEAVLNSVGLTRETATVETLEEKLMLYRDRRFNPPPSA